MSNKIAILNKLTLAIVLEIILKNWMKSGVYVGKG